MSWSLSCFSFLQRKLRSFAAAEVVCSDATKDPEGVLQEMGRRANIFVLQKIKNMWNNKYLFSFIIHKNKCVELSADTYSMLDAKLKTN